MENNLKNIIKNNCAKGSEERFNSLVKIFGKPERYSEFAFYTEVWFTNEFSVKFYTSNAMTNYYVGAVRC